MAFKKELCTGKERHMGNWGGKDSSQTGVVNGFYVAFLCRIKFGVLFLLSAHKCSNDFICTFFFLNVGITLVGIMPSYPECQP